MDLRLDLCLGNAGAKGRACWPWAEGEPGLSGARPFLVTLSQAHWKGNEGFRGEGKRLRRERAGGRGQGQGASPQRGLTSSIPPPPPGPSHSCLLLSLNRAMPFLFPGPGRPVLLGCPPCALRSLLLVLNHTVATPTPPLGRDRREGPAPRAPHTSPGGLHFSAPWLALKQTASHLSS